MDRLRPIRVLDLFPPLRRLRRPRSLQRVVSFLLASRPPVFLQHIYRFAKNQNKILRCVKYLTLGRLKMVVYCCRSAGFP